MRVNLMGMEANPHPCMWICFRIQVYFNVIAHATLYKSNNSNMFLRSVCFYFYYKPHSAFSVMVKPLHCLEYFNLWVCSVAKKKKSPLLPSLLPRNTIYSLNVGSLWTFLKIFQTILTTMISNGRLCAYSLCSGVGQFLLRERLSVSICDASVQSVTLHRKKTATRQKSLSTEITQPLNKNIGFTTSIRHRNDVKYINGLYLECVIRIPTNRAWHAFRGIKLAK